MTVDLSPIIQAAVGFAALAIGTLGGWALQRIAVKLGIQISAERRQQFDQAIMKSAQAGAVAAEDMARVRGWDHPEVRNEMVAQGLQYLETRFVETLKDSGIDPTNPANAERIRGAIERAMPVAAAPVAASPITTSGPVEPATVVIPPAA